MRINLQLQLEDERCLLSYGQLFLGMKTKRVTLTPKVSISNNTYRTITHIWSEWSPLEKLIPSNTINMFEDIYDALGPNWKDKWEIYVDGSWKREGGKLESIFDDDAANTTFSASLVLIARDNNWKCKQILSISIIADPDEDHCSSAFDMELTAVTAGLKLIQYRNLDAVIFSDCKSVMDTLRQTTKLRQWSKKSNLTLLKAGSTIYKDVYKVKSHPEQVEKNKRKWTRQMWGNDLADRSASGLTIDEISCELPNSQPTVLTLQLSLVRKTISLDEKCYWVDKNLQPITQPFEELVPPARLKRYLSDRDSSRITRDPLLLPQWAGRQVKFASLACELKHRTLADRARMIRILWDWNEHGGNLRKQDKTGREKGYCNMCIQTPDSQRHWICNCPNMGAVKIRKDTADKLSTFLTKTSFQDGADGAFAKVYIDHNKHSQDPNLFQLGMLSNLDILHLESKLSHLDVPYILSENTRKRWRNLALEIHHIYIEGVIRLYVHKQSNGKSIPNEDYYDRRREFRLAREDKLKEKLDKQKKNKKKKTEKEILDDYNTLEQQKHEPSFKQTIKHSYFYNLANYKSSEDGRGLDSSTNLFSH